MTNPFSKRVLNAFGANAMTSPYGSGRAVITSVSRIAAALAGTTGTIVT